MNRKKSAKNICSPIENNPERVRKNGKYITTKFYDNGEFEVEVYKYRRCYYRIGRREHGKEWKAEILSVKEQYQER